jgi:colanic acid/amylovoran biosynthesis glycosyltransferase
MDKKKTIDSGIPVAAHFSRTFFAKSETFIYNYVSHLRGFTPICLGWELANRDSFPMPDGSLYCLQLKRFSPRWIYNGILKRMSGGDPYFESVLRKRKARLLHAHFGHNGVYALKVSRKLNIPQITTFYGMDLSNRQMVAELESDYREMFRHGVLFLVEGAHMKEKLAQLGCPPEKIKIQRIAIPVEKITFRPRNAKKASEPAIFIFGGRFAEKKGLIFALEAMRIAREKRQDFEFRIIGAGRLEDEIRAMISRRSMESYVKLLGFLDYSRYLQEMEGADVFIHPSVTAADGDSEGGAPTTILEAQAMGMPIVSTLHADIPNVVVPGQSALLAPERDAVALAEHVLYLLENRDTWLPMGEAGRKFIEEKHDIRIEVVNLERHYNSALEDF